MRQLLELIHGLPSELREKISREYTRIKLREKKEAGWVQTVGGPVVPIVVSRVKYFCQLR